jgi:hypothetical protein
MRIGRASRRLAARAAAVLLVVAGCAQILGLPGDDQLETVATAFCRCTDFESAWPGEDCKSHVEGRLASAPEEVRKAWLDLFSEKECRKCENAEGRAICAGSAPICVNTGGACGATGACCLADGDDVYCGAQGVCVEEPDGCLESNQPCTPGVDVCCGEVGQLASCAAPAGGTPRCVERCDPDDPANCGECCVGVSFVSPVAPPESVSLCLNPENDCTRFCNLAGQGACDPDRVCVPQPVIFSGTSEKAWLETCTARCDTVGTVCGGGCCGRYTNSEGEVALACVPNKFASVAACARLCDASGPDTCDCGNAPCACQPMPLFEGDPLGFAVDRCIVQSSSSSSTTTTTVSSTTSTGGGGTGGDGGAGGF